MVTGLEVGIIKKEPREPARVRRAQIIPSIPEGGNLNDWILDDDIMLQ